jgi:lipid II:glycine glycyltransferase (peptidoglycan interpeptide bridge formation enzyme)
MSRNWRRNLKRDEEAGLEFVEGSDGTLIDGVESIYREMVSRKAFSASESISRLRQIQHKLPDDLKLKIMLCKSEGEICAGLVWSAIGNTGIELIAATSDAGTRIGGSHLLRWKAVESLKQQGIVLYNLNGINPARNPGTYRFKKDLAGTHGRDVFLLGKFDATPGLLIASLVQLRDMLRIWKKRLLR